MLTGVVKKNPKQLVNAVCDLWRRSASGAYLPLSWAKSCRYFDISWYGENRLNPWNKIEFINELWWMKRYSEMSFGHSTLSSFERSCIKSSKISAFPFWQAVRILWHVFNFSSFVRSGLCSELLYSIRSWNRIGICNYYNEFYIKFNRYIASLFFKNSLRAPKAKIFLTYLR